MKIKVSFLKMWILKSLTFILLTSLNCYAANEIPEVSIVADNRPGVSVLHGLTKLTNALQAKNIIFEKVGSLSEAKGKWIIVTGLSSGGGEAAQMLKAGNYAMPEISEALTIRKTKGQNKSVWVISGFDDRGLMYGLLDVAIRIGWGADRKNPMSEVPEITEKPDVSERAISFYTMNRAYWESRFYDEAYWARYLDLLAQNRFNSMVVIFGYENGGFLAPCYPYFFDTEGFSDVRMVGITAQEQQRNLKALNHLIRMAHDRGIRFTVGIWDHIYRGGVQGGGIPGTKDSPDKPVPGLVWGVTGDNLISYTKTALAKFVKLVPDLDAIQFRMHNESGLKKEEQLDFWSDVFKMMKATSPNLRLDLRAKELPEAVVQSALDEGIKFRITTKYWMEQMGMPYHPTQINLEKSPRRHSYADMLRYPQQYKMHWRLWTGGTSRILLWGDPEYVRRFAESTHLYDGDGYEVNEPLATKMEAQPHDAKPFELLNPKYRYCDYEFERYWHFFQVFGRIGYNPGTSPVLWQKEFELRFGKKVAPFIETALHQASWILPRIVASVYPYSGFPMTRGWAEKQRLGNLAAYSKNAGSDIQQFANFDEEAQILIEGGETAKILPSMNSRWFEQTSSGINKLIAEAEKATGNTGSKEFISTITDLKILSNLALYHSRRIPAAVCYRLFERTQNLSALDEAIAYERNAIDAWRQIVVSAGDIYTDDLMMGVRVADLCGHWKDELVSLEKGFADLEQKRTSFKAEGNAKKAPHYKVAIHADWTERFQIAHQPVISNPVGKPLKVSVKMTTPSGVKWVSLSYRSVNQDVEYQTMPMLPTGEKNTFEAIVPAEQINPKWDFMYFIKVMDNDRNGIIYPDLNKKTPYIIVKLIR
ncbi:MAG: hypothetical protein Q8N38_01950 [Bacteroidales bacterium]|nr:hypothetical protein [Bacteroidales bacterium]